MTLLKHELKQGRNMLLIWTAVVAFMLAICILIYPEMEDQMAEVSGMFANMGGFSAAFGMDRINFGEFMGFFSVECGNVLGLGGAFLAALLGISALSKEEKEHTAEFLFTHPVSRVKLIGQKLGAIFLQLVIFHVISVAAVVLSAWIIGEEPDAEKLALLLLAYFILEVETAAICFGISAFISQSGLGIGLGIATLFYFLNIVANLTEKAKFIKYLTPFGYTEGADIISTGKLESSYLLVGLLLTVIGIIAAFWKYNRKDLLS